MVLIMVQGALYFHIPVHFDIFDNPGHLRFIKKEHRPLAGNNALHDNNLPGPRPNSLAETKTGICFLIRTFFVYV